MLVLIMVVFNSMLRLPKCASVRRNVKRRSIHDDDDFVTPPTRKKAVRVKFVAPVSRCVPSSITPIIQRFSAEKKELVAEMGFEGLLHMPLITNHRDFSHWLLSRVSPTRSAIELESGEVLPLSPEDVKKVLGIPCVGEELQAPNVEVVSHVKRLIAERMKVASFKDVNKEVLEDVLDKHHRGQMSKAEKESFKTAFLMLVMMKFLAPQSNMDNKCPRYFSALLDPNEIAKFNWSGYVLNEILDAAATVQKKHADGTKCGYITGCSIYLQVYRLFPNAVHTPNVIII